MMRSLLHACLAAILAAVCLAGAARADVAVRLEQALAQWMEETGTDSAAMAIWRGDGLVRSVGRGRDAEAPVELASLSKAVTGLCAAQMVRAGTWSLETTSRQVLGYGPRGITLSALLTHAGGLGPDQTQGWMPRWLDETAPQEAGAAKRALERDEQSGTSGTHLYNNENYAIIGAMITAQTGLDHRDYCARNVLAPAGVTSADPSPRTGSFAAWGGWQMTVADFARLLHWGFGPSGIIGSRADRWPQSEMGGGAFYGMGMVQRDYLGQKNYWHFGALCIRNRLNIGSYAVRWLDEWSVVVAYDGCLPWEQMARLDALLAGAVFQ